MFEAPSVETPEPSEPKECLLELYSLLYMFAKKFVAIDQYLRDDIFQTPHTYDTLLLSLMFIFQKWTTSSDRQCHHCQICHVDHTTQ